MYNQLPEYKEALARAKKIRVKVYVTADEREAIIENARACGVSTAAFVRHIALGYRPTTILGLENMPKLMRANENLCRLGRLLKLWLTDEIRLMEEYGGPVEDLLAEITETLDGSGEAICQLMGTRKGGR